MGHRRRTVEENSGGVQDDVQETRGEFVDRRLVMNMNISTVGIGNIDNVTVTKIVRFAHTFTILCFLYKLLTYNTTIVC